MIIFVAELQNYIEFVQFWFVRSKKDQMQMQIVSHGRQIVIIIAVVFPYNFNCRHNLMTDEIPKYIRFENYLRNVHFIFIALRRFVMNAVWCLSWYKTAILKLLIVVN